MRVIGYTRVSTAEQASSGLSLEAQERKIRGHCDLHELELAEIYTDAGWSGKDLHRPGIQEAFEALARGDAEGLIVAKMDRLSRDVRDWAWICAELFGEGSGRSLISVSDAIDTGSASGRLVLHILASVSQWEREAIGERIKAALHEKIENEEHIGVAPFGTRYSEDGRLEPDPDSFGLVIAARARELRAIGLSYAKVATELTREGYRPPRAEKFSPAGVRNICTNPRITKALDEVDIQELIGSLSERAGEAEKASMQSHWRADVAMKQIREDAEAMAAEDDEQEELQAG